MKKIKLFGIAVAVGFTMLYSTQTNAKVVMQYAYIFDNGCIGTHTYHSTLFGLYTWETFEVVACP